MKELLKTTVVLVAVFCMAAGCEPYGDKEIEILSRPQQQAPAAQVNEPLVTQPELPESQPREKEDKQPEISPALSQADEFNSVFSLIFKNYVDDNGFVNYAKLRRMRATLNYAINKLSNVKQAKYDKWLREEKIAFWINAYNVFTLKVVVNNYPIKPVRYKILFNYPVNSIAHISGFWTRDYFNVMGRQYTLREIERDVLLKEFGDARICFALSYATRSSAPLRNESFLGESLDEQLDDQAKKFFANNLAFKIDAAGKTVYLSTIFSIFDWHKDVFLNQCGTDENFRQQQPIDRAALNCIKNYISETDADYLLKQKYTVKYIKYDWTLNEQRK